MNAGQALAIVAVLMAPVAAHAQDIEVQTSVSQTALWVGLPVTYTVTLSCRPGVDVLQEDLAADKLPVDGLQVVGHTIGRRLAADGRIEYAVSYQLATFEPGAETVGVRDWVVRYAASAQAAGQSAPARELTVPGAPLAWRSALPGAIATLDLRSPAIPEAAPGWWQSTRSVSLSLLTLSVLLFAVAIVRQMTAGRPLRARRRAKRASAQEVEAALGAIAGGGLDDPARRRAAFDTLDATIRRMVADMTLTPASALTPNELRARLVDTPAPVAVDEIARVLEACERARYQPIARLPDAAEFDAAVQSARQALASRR